MSLTLRPFTECDGYLPVPCGDARELPLAVLPNLPMVALTENPSLADIHAFEDVLMALPSRVALRNEYFFAPGVCLKSLRMPAGIAATGKMHKTEHLSVLAEGTLRITTPSGMQTLTAPAIIHSHAFVKRVAFALTDCTFITIHANPTDETDEERIDAMLYVPDRPLDGVAA